VFETHSSSSSAVTDPESPATAWGAVHELFEAQAARRPDAEAVRGAGRSLTYRALNARANQLARRLRAHGVGRGTRVGLFLDRSIELVVGILGVLKAGGAYVPLETTQPASRLTFMVRDARLPLVLTREALRPVFEALNVNAVDSASASTETHVMCVETLAAESVAENDANLGLDVSGEDLVYVIYTSGSTGQPKGTEVPHRAIPGFVLDVDYMRFDEHQTLLVHSSISWDAFTLELWPALLTGGTCAVVADRLVRAVEVGRAIAEHKVTTLFLPSSLFNAVVDEEIEVLAGLQQLLIGGEALSPVHVRRVVERYPALRVVNGYGPSECTVVSTCQVISPALLADGGAVPIGPPIGDRRVLVLDRDLRLVPSGVMGEVYVGGPAVARGYGQRPALTAERFVPDPYGEAGGRLYRTGDLARWRQDGSLDFVGRLDDQVKVRGYRVELGEVETALRACRGVREAAVLACADTAGSGNRLVGYVVGEAEWPLAAVTAELVTRVPAYMVPTAWVRLAALPLTLNGKLDRAALPAPSTVRPELGDAITPPRDAVEAALAEIWSAVLGVTGIGVHDDFFALGGHSLTAGRVLARVQAALNVELPLRALFDAPTIAGLAQRVTAARTTQDASNAPALVPIDRTGPLPLSFAQERLWFLQQLAPASAEYNIPIAYRIRGKVSVTALEASVDEIVRRHHALRTRIDATVRNAEGVPRQSVLAHARVPLAIIDLRGVAEREARLRDLLRDEAARPFDLSEGPLVRGQLVQLGDAEHVLSLCQHHIASDGWSVGVLARELGALYSAFCAGDSTPLAEPTLQYGDYAVWQRQWLDGECVERQLSYWKQRLSAAPPLSTFPGDRARPKVRRGRGARLPVRFDPELSGALAGLGSREGTTLFMTLLAGFHALMSRYSGQTDVIVGTPVAGRTRPELEAMIGFFVNSLALRADLSSDPPFQALLHQTRESVLDAHANQDVPFERLVEALAPERDLSRTPLFQVMFAFHPAAVDVPRMPGLETVLEPVETSTSTFDLTLNLHPDAGGIAGWIDYDTDLFDAATIARLIDSYTTLLGAATEDPERRVSELQLLDRAERRRLLTAWNATDRPLPETPVHTWIEERCAREPETIAVVCGDTSLTCAELDARANRLAHFLMRHGVRPGDGVGLGLERSVEMVVAMLAVVKAGAFYLPLDPALPAERRQFILEDSRVRLLLVDDADANVPIVTGVTVIRLASARDAIDAEPRTRPAAPATLDHIAYVLYTSGSTGRPKGVAVGHRALANLLQSFVRESGVGPGDTLVAVATLSFDIAELELYLPLVVGARLVVTRRDEGSDPRALRRLVERHAATVLQATPPMWLMLLDAGWPVPGPRKALSGGEAMPRTLAARLLEHLDVLWNLYGPTETTIWSTSQRVAPGDGPVPIGRPIDNTQTYVLDSHLEPVPEGVTGELYIAGTGLALGYLGRADVTAQKFVPNPFGSPGTRLYSTGDRVRQRDGVLEFVERRDHQIKIRGFRVELGEVEAALERLPDVRRAVVVAHGEAADKRLVAYVLPADGALAAAALAAVLRERLGETLPGYMVPSVFMTLDSFPIGPTGKVDRRALPAPVDGERQSERPYVAPQTPLEETVAAVWAEVLGIARPGVRDNFFELGGHSLKAIQVLARLRARTGADVPLQTFFAAPTIERLAQAVQGAVSSTQPVLVAGSCGEDAPLSLHQQRLWFLDQLEPGSAAYNIPTALRLSGDLDVAALQRALTEVVRRHQVLRTTFVVRDGEPWQRVGDAAIVPLPVEDLRGLSAIERDNAAASITAEETARPFDLAHGPLMRCRLVRIGDTDSLLLLTFHHIVSDAWSLAILARELRALYGTFGAFVADRPSPLAEPAVQYADFARWQRNQLDDASLGRQLAYWNAQLDGAPTLLELPADRPRPATRSLQGALLRFSLPADLVAAVRRTGQDSGATLYMTLLAAFAALLNRYTGANDLLIGSPVASRRRVELEGLIGFFVNTLVMRVRFDRDLTVADLLSHVRASCIDAQAHQDVPFERVVEELQPARSLGHAPLVQAMLVFDSAEPEVVDWSGVRVQSVPVDIATTKHDLTLYLTERADGIDAAFNYSTDLFDAGTIARFAGHFQVLLAALTDDPARRVADLSLLTPEERRMLLADWSRTEKGRDAGLCVHEIVDLHAMVTPDAPAVVFEDASLSYRELNARAAAVARRLRALGVGPDSRVALCAERSLEMIVGLMGVLKAGAAYVPLDPDLPLDRLAYMLSDSQARALLFTRGAEDVARCAARLASGAGSTLMPAVRLENKETALYSEDVAVAPGSTPDNLAYVIYTSGSTGRPKGVAVEHRHLVGYALGVSSRIELPDGAHFATVSTIAADLGNTAIFSALCLGGCVHVVSRTALSDPEAMGTAFARRGVDGLKIVPSHLSALLGGARPARVLPRARLVLGGEASPWSLIDRVRELAPACEVFNHYGPTETTVGVLTHRLGTPGERRSRTLPVGRPLPGVRVYVVDAELHLTPAGVPGELLVGGASVARGYLGRAALTAASFIPDPFSEEPGQRVYRTGDRVRFLPDGSIEFLGRVDDQIKIRGYRVEPGEVTALLRAQPHVRNAAVVALPVESARPDGASPAGGDDVQLVAYFVPEPGAPVDLAEQLHVRLARVLPAYMVPSAFVALDVLPVTANGKLDRRALPRPERHAPRTDQEAPRTEIQQRTARIWEEVLGVDGIALDDDFFSLGGHSLKAVRLLSRVREAFGSGPALRTLFEAPTLGAFAAAIERELASAARTGREDAAMAVAAGGAAPIRRAARSRS
jgi:amino acid adenylation domain-containing protein